MRLRAENKALRAENEALRAENATLRRENAELRLMLQSALATIESLRAEVAELRARLNANSTNSSRPPSSDGPEVQRPLRPRSGRPPGGQPGHPGHQRSLFPQEQVQHFVPCKPTRCPRCEHLLKGEDPHPTRHQVVEVPPLKPVVTEYQLHELECPECGAKTRAALPPEAVRLLGPKTSAMVAALTGRFHLSKRLTCMMLEEFFGLRVSPGTISQCEDVVSQALEQPVEDAWESIRQQPVLFADPTGWKEQKKRVWLWVGATSTAVGFKITTTHARSVSQRVIGEKTDRHLVTDRGAEFRWYRTGMRQLCWAHLRRNFKGWSERAGPAREYGEKLLELSHCLFHEWHRFKQGELTRKTLGRRIKPIREQVESLLEAAQKSGHRDIDGRAKALLNLKDALWNFVEVEGVEPTNNLSERMLRQAVIWRKLCFGTKSERGSRFVERILTACETLKLQGRNVLTYVAQAVEAYTCARPIPALVPAHP